MKAPEYWVMRVMLHQGRPVKYEQMDLLTNLSTRALVSAGDLAMLPDGSIAEPVEVFDDEMAAHAHREKLRRDNPREDFRVIINADITV